MEERVLLNGYEITLSEIEEQLKEMNSRGLHLLDDVPSEDAYYEVLREYYINTSVPIIVLLAKIRAFRKVYFDQES